MKEKLSNISQSSSPPFERNQTRSARQTTWPLWLLSAPLLLFLAIPLVALFLRTTPEQIWTNLATKEVYQAIRVSMVTATAATILGIATGMPVAYLLARGDFRSRRILDSLIDLPTVLPPAVAGVALLVAFGRRGLVGAWLGSLGLDISFTPLAVVLAQLFISAPLFIKSASVGIASVDRELELSAAMDGAGAWRIFWHVTLPLSRRGVIGGALLAWSRALGEFGATIIFAGNYPGRTQTMPLAIYLGFELDLEVALTLAVILVGISFAALFLIKGVVQKD